MLKRSKYEERMKSVNLKSCKKTKKGRIFMPEESTIYTNLNAILIYTYNASADVSLNFFLGNRFGHATLYGVRIGIRSTAEQAKDINSMHECVCVYICV